MPYQVERGRTYVQALDEDRRPVVEVLRPGDVPPMLPTATTGVELRTTYTDRSKGFQVATVPVAVAFGLGALVVAIVGYSVPAVSIAALAVFWLGFLAWWVMGWAIHHIVSPDGLALLQALLGYRYLRHEQRERLRRYGLHERR